MIIVRTKIAIVNVPFMALSVGQPAASLLSLSFPVDTAEKKKENLGREGEGSEGREGAVPSEKTSSGGCSEKCGGRGDSRADGGEGFFLSLVAKEDLVVGYAREGNHGVKGFPIGWKVCGDV